MNEEADPRSGIAIIPFEGGRAIKRFNSLVTSSRWRPDGRTLTYVETRKGVSNIWGQQIDSSQPEQLTNFKSDRIYWFDWSRDGKQLACVRVIETDDVVLINNIK